MPKSNDALEILARMTKDDLEVQVILEESSLNAEIARMIYQARTRAGLTQKQLADRIGTQQSVISRLEDADYDGHSLSMLQSIARALNQRLELNLVPLDVEYDRPQSA
jgi:transcriptional regulator with XRE-family HTH domain